MVSVSRCWLFARCASPPPCTTWSHAARASVAAKRPTNTTTSRRMRRFACFSRRLAAKRDVPDRRRICRYEAVLPVREVLDPRRGEPARQLRLERRRLRVQLRALLRRVVELEVQPQHGHVHEYDAGEQNPADGDPEDAAASAPLPRLRSRLCLR